MNRINQEEQVKDGLQTFLRSCFKKPHVGGYKFKVLKQVYERALIRGK